MKLVPAIAGLWPDRGRGSTEAKRFRHRLPRDRGAFVGPARSCCSSSSCCLASGSLPWFGGGRPCGPRASSLPAGPARGYAWARPGGWPRRQRTSTCALTAALALVLWRAFAWPSPITPDGRLSPLAFDQPIRSILWLLLTAIGLPFVALGATSPLLQAWFARLRPGASPFRLFALSNAGSLAGLVGYPLVIERTFGVVAQGWLWSATFVAFAVGVGWCALETGRTAPVEPTSAAEPAPHARAQDPREALCASRTPFSRRCRSQR